MYTAKQVAQIQKKFMETPEALRRASDADYTKGYFMVTLNVHDYLPILGKMKGKYLPDSKQVCDAGVELTDLGKAVWKCWEEIPHYHPNTKVITGQVMPEHFHGLIYLSEHNTEHLGKIINGFMIGCTHSYWEILGVPWRDSRDNLRGVSDSRWTDWQHKRSLRGPSLFAPYFNDTIALAPDEVETKIAYIHSNPERRVIKGSQKDCFTVFRQQTSAHWTEERVKGGLKADYAMSCQPERLEEEWLKISPRLLRSESVMGDERLALSYVGDKAILLSEKKLPLICHRADEKIWSEQMDAIIREAQNGAVIVSAFISAKEREIRDLLLQQGCCIIEIIDNGMKPVYKPWGKAFYYCAENRLVQVSCWTYLFQRDAAITRSMCMVMNELARLIAGKQDDWWKK